MSHPAFPEVTGKRVLALGLGGGADAVTAYALACVLGADVAYGNTKHAPGETPIERRLPRGPHGSPLVLTVGGELPQFELIIGVDTGGDVLDTSPRGEKGRDRRMLHAIKHREAVVVVVAPGADGQLAPERLAPMDEHGTPFSLEPLLPFLREHGAQLATHRTPNIICRAFDEPTDPVEIPRGRRPKVPRAWLTTGYVFSIAALMKRC